MVWELRTMFRKQQLLVRKQELMVRQQWIMVCRQQNFACKQDMMVQEQQTILCKPQIMVRKRKWWLGSSEPWFSSNKLCFNVVPKSGTVVWADGTWFWQVAKGSRGFLGKALLPSEIEDCLRAFAELLPNRITAMSEITKVSNTCQTWRFATWFAEAKRWNYHSGNMQFGCSPDGSPHVYVFQNINNSDGSPDGSLLPTQSLAYIKHNWKHKSFMEVLAHRHILKYVVYYNANLYFVVWKHKHRHVFLFKVLR